MKRKVNLLSEYDNPSLADPGTKKLPWRGGCKGVGFKESQRRRLMYCRNHATLYECSIQGGVRLTEESVTRVECNKQFGTRVVHPCLSPATFLFCQTKIVDSARCPSNIKRVLGCIDDISTCTMAATPKGSSLLQCTVI